MAKKYIPSGYQIISIDSTIVDEVGSDEYLKIQTEDDKILEKMFKTNDFSKPILLMDKGTGLMGFPTIIMGEYPYLSLNTVVYDDGNYVGTSLILSWYTNKILVSRLEY